MAALVVQAAILGEVARVLAPVSIPDGVAQVCFQAWVEAQVAILDAAARVLVQVSTPDEVARAAIPALEQVSILAAVAQASGQAGFLAAAALVAFPV